MMQLKLNDLIENAKAKALKKSDLWNRVKAKKCFSVAFGLNDNTLSLLNVVSLSAIVDDFTNETSFEGIPIIRTEQLYEYDELVVINCVINSKPKSALNKINNLGVFEVISYTEAMYLDEALEVPSFIQDTRECFTEYNRGEWFEVYRALEDDESKKTFLNIISYRISGDLDYVKDYTYRPEAQYLEDFMSYEDEIFVDIGGYDGDTAEVFLSQFPSTKKYYIFEPDLDNINKAKVRLSHYSQVEYVNKGASNVTGHLRFNAAQKSSCSISEDGDVTIDVVRLDDFLKDHVSVIKMDVEGHESMVLSGMAETIKKSHPKLAVCVYHKGKDMIDLFNKVMSQSKHYRVYLRHYSESWTETVMYFLPKS